MEVSEQVSILKFAKEHDRPIEALDLSTRVYNVLKRNNVNTLSELANLYPNGYGGFRNIGQKTVNEINDFIKNISTNIDKLTQEDFRAYIEDVTCEEDDRIELGVINIESLSALQLFQNEKTKDKAWEYLYTNDIEITSLNLSKRSVHALSNFGLTKLSSLVKVYPAEIIGIKNLGTKSIDEIKSVVQSQLEKIKPFVKAYCKGDMQALYSNEYIRKTILDLFADIGFTGMSFKEIKEKFPEGIDEARIKKSIGGLIRDHALEYVDFRCYKVYPSYLRILERDFECSRKRGTEYLIRRYNNETLESIAESEGLTRERIRQICEKKENAIKNQYKAETGLKFFDEDYYAYIFSNYDVPKELLIDYLNASNHVWAYLNNTYSKGNLFISESLSDPQIDVSMKYRIRDYLNRNKIEIDGELLEKKRPDIINFILEHYCQDELTYDEFVVLYNDILKKNKINDNNLLITDDDIRSDIKRALDSKKCLWKQGKRLRYYDIDAGNYDELLETINLSEYSDIDISTLKFIEDYPEVMEKYDIRDEYELHNLLKKVIGSNASSGITFSRQPVITFGQSNRVELYKRILNDVSPVTAEEFAEYIHMENGFNKQTIMASPEMRQLSQYYHDGIYSVDFKCLTDYHAQKLSTLLVEDFYYIDEILKIYKNNFDDADLECINPRSLKSIGFNVLSKYAIRNYTTAESYFKDILTKNDVFAIKTYHQRYGKIMMYNQVVNDLMKSYEIFKFDNGQYINFRRLAKADVDKQLIEDFCNKVNSFVSTNTYFTIQSLKGDGFSHELENLGFDDIFYANILAVSPLFCYQRVYGSIVLYSGRGKKNFSIKAFIRNLLEKYDVVDIDDFMDDVYEKYGVRIPEKYVVTDAVSGTGMYYDRIMNKIYSSKSIYYSDLDD